MANRFWILGTGTWDGSTTTHWATTSGAGSGGASVPGSADTAIFDSGSGGGTVTVNTTVNITSIEFGGVGAYTGTVDFSVNNNNVTLSNTLTSPSSGGTLNMGNGTWTMTTVNQSTPWNSTGITLNANGSTLSFTGTRTTVENLTITGQSLNNLSVAGGTVGFAISAGTISGTLTVTAPCTIELTSAATLTITGAITANGTSTQPILITSNSFGAAATLSVAATSVLNWCAIKAITLSGAGSILASNSFNLGNNTGSGLTINPPPVGIIA